MKLNTYFATAEMSMCRMNHLHNACCLVFCLTSDLIPTCSGVMQIQAMVKLVDRGG